MKILIAVPTFETVAPETFKSIFDLDMTDHRVSFECVKGYDCARARNEIAKLALEGGFDYVMMIDSDVVIPSDTLRKFLEFPCDIVLGCCIHKNSRDGRIEIYKPGTFDFTGYYTYDTLPGFPRVRVKGGGLACALINTEVFRQMAFPYFRFVTYDNNTMLSEDLYFCLKASQAGFSIEADTRIRCGHLARYVQYE